MIIRLFFFLFIFYFKIFSQTEEYNIDELPLKYRLTSYIEVEGNFTGNEFFPIFNNTYAGKQGYLYSYNLVDPKTYLSFLFMNESIVVSGYFFFKNREKLIADIVFSEETYFKEDIFQVLVDTKSYNKGWEFNNNTLTYDRIGFSLERFRVRKWSIFEYLDFGFRLNVDWGRYFIQKNILGIYLKSKNINLFKDSENSIDLITDIFFSPTIDKILNENVNIFFLGGMKWNLLFSFFDFKFSVNYGTIYLTRFSYERERENKYVYIKIKSDANFDYTNDQTSNYPVLVGRSVNAVLFFNDKNEAIKKFDVTPLQNNYLVDKRKSWLVPRAVTRVANNDTPPHDERDRIAVIDGAGNPVFDGIYSGSSEIFRQGNNSTTISNETFFHKSEIIYRFPLNDYQQNISYKEITKIQVSFNLKYSMKYEFSFDNRNWIEVFEVDDPIGENRKDLGEEESIELNDDLRWQGNVTTTKFLRKVSFSINFNNYKTIIDSSTPDYQNLTVHHFNFFLSFPFEIFGFSSFSFFSYEMNVKDFSYAGINSESRKKENFHFLSPMSKISFSNKFSINSHSFQIEIDRIEIDKNYHRHFYENDLILDQDRYQFLKKKYGTNDYQGFYKSQLADKYQPYIPGLMVEKKASHELSLNIFWKRFFLEEDYNNNGHVDFYENDISLYNNKSGTLGHKVYFFYNFNKEINFDFFYRKENILDKKNNLFFIKYEHFFLDYFFSRLNYSQIQDEYADDLYYEVYYETEVFFTNETGVFLKDNLLYEDEKVLELSVGFTNLFSIDITEEIKWGGENYIRSDFFSLINTDIFSKLSFLGEGYSEISMNKNEKKVIGLKLGYQFKINLTGNEHLFSRRDDLDFNFLLLLNFSVDSISINLGNSTVNMNNYPFYIRQLVNTSMINMKINIIEKFFTVLGYKYMIDIYQTNRKNHLIFFSTKLEI